MKNSFKKHFGNAANTIEDAEYTVFDEEGQISEASVPIADNPAGRISGIVLIISGWILISLALFLLLPIGGIALIFRSIAPLLSIPSIIVLAGIVMIIFGGSKRRRVKRFYDYTTILLPKGFGEIHRMAEKYNYSDRFVRRDLKKMIDLKMFPEGRMDDAKKYIFLSERVYQEYQKLQESMKARQREAEAVTRRCEKEQQNPAYKDVYQALNVGREQMEEINQAANTLKSNNIAQNVMRLDKIVGCIFDYVEENPSAYKDVRRLMNYYLPTLLKLITTYQQMDNEQIQGPVIHKTKNGIEDVLEKIIQAFETIYDGFYMHTAVDVSADISVLESMLKTDGWIDEQLKSGGAKDE